MGAVSVAALTAERRDQWQRFIAASNNGTVFHNLDFLAYHAPGRCDFRHLMFFEDGELVAVLAGGMSGTVYRSPVGATFGGFVFAPGVRLATADAVVKACLEWCRTQGVSDIVITPPMQPYHRTFDEAFEFAMLYNGFAVRNALYSSLIDLSRIRSKADLSRNTRHRINQAINKHVRVEESHDLAAFYPILLENKAKFGAKPTHTLEELEHIDRLVPGMMTLFLAYHGEQCIAGELLFAANDRCVLNFYTMHLYRYHHLFAVNYLVEHAIRWSAARGFRYYDYGVSADTASPNPLEPSWSLVRFKESMGSTGCMRVTYGRTIARE